MILIVNYGSPIPSSNTNHNIMNKAKEIFGHFLVPFNLNMRNKRGGGWWTRNQSELMRDRLNV